MGRDKEISSKIGTGESYKKVEDVKGTVFRGFSP